MEKLFLPVSLPADLQDDEALLYLLRSNDARCRSHTTGLGWVKRALTADKAVNRQHGQLWVGHRCRSLNWSALGALAPPSLSTQLCVSCLRSGGLAAPRAPREAHILPAPLQPECSTNKAKEPRRSQLSARICRLSRGEPHSHKHSSIALHKQCCTRLVHSTLLCPGQGAGWHPDCPGWLKDTRPLRQGAGAGLSGPQKETSSSQGQIPARSLVHPWRAAARTEQSSQWQGADPEVRITSSSLQGSQGVPQGQAKSPHHCSAPEQTRLHHQGVD